MEFGEVIKMRCSVRRFSDRPVEEEKVKEIFESARLAPSWANKQSWSFVAVRDKEKIALVVKVAGTLNSWLKTAPMIVIACGDPRLSGKRESIEYFGIDVAIAAEHLVLAAANAGLGSCWVGVFDEKKIKEILGIPEEIRIVSMIPIGYPAENQGIRADMSRFVLGSKKRKPLTEIVHYDSW